MPDSVRPAFDAYTLPLPPRRQGRGAAALSFVAHVTIAVLVLWRGAELFQSGGGGGSGPRGGGGGGGRPAVSWVALPAAPAAAPPEEQTQAPPAVTVPTAVIPAPTIAKIDVPLVPPPPVPATTAPVGTGDGTTGGPGQGPGSGGGRGTGTGTGVGADSGSGSGGDASDIFPASPRWAVLPPRGAPRGVQGKRYEVRFWVTAEGRVTRVEVTPPIKDSDYAREFRERMMGYLFNPATTRDGRRIDYIASAIVIP